MNVPEILIRPYWNVNVTELVSGGTLTADINKTILECKLLYPQISIFIFYINKTILECKYRPSISDIFMSYILIRPYWNVNAETAFKLQKQILILIRPYWNVNFFHDALFLVFPFILIRPYWNVNHSNSRTSNIKFFILIRPYWNVNKTYTLFWLCETSEY
mgnify:CR=1 FL=1